MATQEQPPTNSSQSSIEDGTREEGVHLLQGSDSLFTSVGIVNLAQQPEASRITVHEPNGMSDPKLIAELGPDHLLNQIQLGRYQLTKHRPQI